MRCHCVDGFSNPIASTSGRFSGPSVALPRNVSLQKPQPRRGVVVNVSNFDSDRLTVSQQEQQANTAVSPQTSAQARQYAMQYQELKDEMLGRTQRFGAFLAAYLLLTVSGPAALAALIGSSASYAYLILLQQQIDAVLPTDSVPIWDAEDNVEGFARPFAIGAAAYRAALRPRLLVPVGLAAGVWACNFSGLHTVTQTEEGCLVLGFLSFKAALLLNVWYVLKPRYDSDALKRPKRPVQDNFGEQPDISDVMDNIASVRKIGNKQF